MKKCLKCKSDKFKIARARFHPQVRDESVDVVVDASVCLKCGEALMNDIQMDGLRRSAADVYREKHGLLTSKQISAYRNKLNMSQREFADYLGVGEASIKRWETSYIQDKSQDNLIRLKCDENDAERSALDIHRRIHKDDSFTGNVQFNQERVRNLILRFVGVTKSQLFLNKALFYVDFLHFKKNGRGITGLSYFPIEYGPCPYRYNTLYEPLLKNGDLSRGKGHILNAEKKHDDSIFDSKEIETIEAVYNFIKKKSKEELLKMSHEESAYTETDEGALINYQLAKKLKFDGSTK